MTSEDAIRLLISFSRFTCLNSEASEINGWNAMRLHRRGKCYGVEMTRKGSEKVTRAQRSHMYPQQFGFNQLTANLMFHY